MKNKRIISILLVTALIAGIPTAAAASTNQATDEKASTSISSETGVLEKIENLWKNFLSMFSVNSTSDADSSTTTQLPSTPTQLSATSTQVPSTLAKHYTTDDDDDNCTVNTQSTTSSWSTQDADNTNTNPSTGR